MSKALDEGYAKLSYYYGDTQEEHSKILAISTILAPEYRLGFF